jgi:hypothetical protein
VKTRLPFIDAQYPFADMGVIERTIQTRGRQSNGIALFRYTSAFSHSLGGKRAFPICPASDARALKAVIAGGRACRGPEFGLH